jgi:hypothetical protein
LFALRQASLAALSSAERAIFGLGILLFLLLS